MMNFENYPNLTHLEGPLKRYVERGIMPGGFLTAVLENDLMNAFACADSQNSYLMKEIVTFMYNEMPLSCWGSKENVRNYIQKKS